ncbi:protein bunched, class 2/F/G isoform-like isoform X3 [Pomacea canaliculata]|uniref:protein bunched, class 2/F/G isoform-like isoform X3 n=1 Tax=Pomacea canaliculata TaxID=400727 RepID=UPI000D73398A|nr:protein bunched, class 2/F/G isoform-like isoform X3 [Pomacea canaliculata]
MADRSLFNENMAVSSDSVNSQHNLKDNSKDENELRSSQSYSKTDAPKKKTTFKIIGVTYKSQRGGSGDLTQDNDGDSIDDLDETVDSHTEDYSSEFYDTSSRATDVDNQDPLTPEEVIKEKPVRFKVVKIESKEPFKRGRWMCYDYLDGPEKVENKQDEISVNSGSSSATNSVHYVHGVDDPSKNPLLAGASGTVVSQHHQSSLILQDMSSGSGGGTRGPGEMFQPIQPASTSHLGMNQAPLVSGQSLPNVSYQHQGGQSMLNAFSNIAQSARPTQTLANTPVYSSQGGHPISVPYPVIGAVHSTAPMNQPLQPGASLPALTQTQVNASLPGGIPYPSAQVQPQQQQQQPPAAMTAIIPTIAAIPATMHSQPATLGPGIGLAAAPIGITQVPSSMQPGDLVSSATQVQASVGQPAVLQPQQQPQVQQLPPPSQPQQVAPHVAYETAVPQTAPGFNLLPSAAAGSIPPSIPQQNHLPTSSVETAQVEGLPSGDQQKTTLAPSKSSADLSGTAVLRPEMPDGADETSLGHGLVPLDIGVAGISSPNPEEEIAEEAFLDFFSLTNFDGSALLLPTMLDEAGLFFENEFGSSTVAIDNKIEQAMDLVKSHLMYAVREEVEVLKEQIKELTERIAQLEIENAILKAAASPETLLKLPTAQSQVPPPVSSSS